MHTTCTVHRDTEQLLRTFTVAERVEAFGYFLQFQLSFSGRCHHERGKSAGRPRPQSNYPPPSLRSRKKDFLVCPCFVLVPRCGCYGLYAINRRAARGAGKWLASMTKNALKFVELLSNAHFEFPLSVTTVAL